jgi:hypothetical protein
VEINGCISSGRFAEYVNFKVGRLSNYEKVKDEHLLLCIQC